jgi:hypothetical protein
LQKLNNASEFDKDYKTKMQIRLAQLWLDYGVTLMRYSSEKLSMRSLQAEIEEIDDGNAWTSKLMLSFDESGGLIVKRQKSKIYRLFFIVIRLAEVVQN